MSSMVPMRSPSRSTMVLPRQLRMVSMSTICFLLAPCPCRHAPLVGRARHHTEADHRAIRPNRSKHGRRPPTAPAPWLRAYGLLAGLVADLLAALLGPLGGVAGRLLGDLLAALQGLLPGLLDRVFDLVGHRTQPLVLDPGRRHGQAG